MLPAVVMSEGGAFGSCGLTGLESDGLGLIVIATSS